jgi:hypothetical protein
MMAQARRLAALDRGQIERMTERYSEMVALARRTGNPTAAAAVPRSVDHYRRGGVFLRPLNVSFANNDKVPNLDMLDEMLVYMDDDMMQALRDDVRDSFGCQGRIETQQQSGAFGREIDGTYDCIGCFPVRPRLTIVAAVRDGVVRMDDVNVPTFWAEMGVSDVLSRVDTEALEAELARRLAKALEAQKSRDRAPKRRSTRLRNKHLRSNRSNRSNN